MVGGFRLHVLMCLTSALVTAGMPSIAQEARWPSKPIRIIVPYPPASPGDTVARGLSAFLGPKFNQAVVVENRGGAAGAIAMLRHGVR